MNILLLEQDERELAARDNRARHVRKVLKLGAGDRLRAGIVNGPVGMATILSIQGGILSLGFEPDVGNANEKETNRPPAERTVDLILGHPRPIVLKRMLRDLCTVGVRRLLVVPTELGERSYLAATMWDNIRPYLIEGAAQAGVTRLMEVTRCGTLAAGIRQALLENQLRVVLHPNPDCSLSAALAASECENAVLAVGSERGWTPSEVDEFNSAGFSTADMGDRTLRTEMAATVAGWAARWL